MAYREEASDVLEAPTAEGTLTAELGPRSLRLSVAARTLQLADRRATLIDHKKNHARTSWPIAGLLFSARDVPHEDLGIWLEVDPGAGPRTGMRRIFGVEPVDLLDPSGLAALASLDRLAHRLRGAIAEYAGDIRRAVEVGRGLDKVLLADHGDRYLLYARRLFRDRARFTAEIHRDGRIVVPQRHGPPREVVVRSRYGITVVGDYVRFAAPDGADLARVAIPWIAPEDRRELARRIGQLVDAAGR
ncbi:MAG: hypothetical protein ACTHU0_16510 [Kofleriaceae bacterium]